MTDSRSHPASFWQLPADVRRLFLTRFLRLFAFGLLSVSLALYLAARGLGPAAIGALLTCALIGDTVVSLLLTTRADRLGRRRVLSWGALLMVLAAALLGIGDAYALLLVAATIGIISPSGAEVGPFLSLEQAALAEFVPAEQRTSLLASYNLVGSIGTALGAFCGGWIVSAGPAYGLDGASAYWPLLWIYAGVGGVLAWCFTGLSVAVEISHQDQPGSGARWGLHRSRERVLRLSGLFALDALGGGFVIQSALAYWLHVRFSAEPGQLGTLFLGLNVLGGLSYLAAGWLARRIGLLNTMVFTHLPANVLLMLLPLMPSFTAACALLLVRALITQMDVPTRQAYLLAVVSADERSAAGGITSVARSIGAALSPPVTVILAGSAAWAGAPFVIGGALKIGYDLLLYRGFRRVRPEHEVPTPGRNVP